MCHLDSRWRVCWSNAFPSSGAECLQHAPTSPAVSVTGCLSRVPGDYRPHGTELRLAWCNTTQHSSALAVWEELFTWCKSYSQAVRLSPQKIIAVISLSCRLMPNNTAGTAEIFVVFKRSQNKEQDFHFSWMVWNITSGEPLWGPFPGENPSCL